MLSSVCRIIHRKLCENYSSFPLWFFPNVSSLIQQICLGKELHDDEHDEIAYKQYVEMVSLIVKYDSQLYMDILDHLKKKDRSYGDLLLAKSVNLPKVQEILSKANVMLKKGQRISNRKWHAEVSSVFGELVKFCYLCKL